MIKNPKYLSPHFLSFFIMESSNRKTFVETVALISGFLQNLQTTIDAPGMNTLTPSERTVFCRMMPDVISVIDDTYIKGAEELDVEHAGAIRDEVKAFRARILSIGEDTPKGEVEGILKAMATDDVRILCGALHIRVLTKFHWKVNRAFLGLLKCLLEICLQLCPSDQPLDHPVFQQLMNSQELPKTVTKLQDFLAKDGRTPLDLIQTLLSGQSVEGLDSVFADIVEPMKAVMADVDPVALMSVVQGSLGFLGSP